MGMGVSILITLLIALGTTARLTRLVVADILTAPLRARATSRFGVDSKRAYLLSCAWCSSIWVAALIAPAAWLASPQLQDIANPVFVIPGLALTLSYASSVISQNLD